MKDVNIERTLSYGRYVIDGRHGPWVTKLYPVVWSHDGTRFAYRAFTKGLGSYLLVIDGKEIAEGQFISDPAFSPDSKHVAYVMAIGGVWRVLVDEVVIATYIDKISEIAWSPDSEHVAYVVESNPLRVAVDGRALLNQRYAGDLRFEPDGSVVFKVKFQK